jgi:ligand-binding SRPBCC domain-containing protein
MSFHQFYKTQIIIAPLEAVWEFISSPANLKLITPDYMGFDITSVPSVGRMYPGMMLSYELNLFPWHKTNWLTEITHVKEKEYFVDEQRVGPYSLWHHEHFLHAIGDIVIMKDKITYEPPFGILGTLVNALFIEKKLKEIFDYRENSIDEFFEEKNEPYMSVV